MALYRVMLVDDEEEVIQAIIQKMNWEELGFEVVGYAKNGEDALELLDAISPDVIMTDIKMPFMDGLTLCKNVKEQYNDIRMVIFSGFDEFEYAREAIKYEAEEYILKPINSKELEEVFVRLRESLDKERLEKRDIDKLREYYLKSLPTMQEQFLANLIEGRIPDSQIGLYLEMYRLPLFAPFYLAAVIHLDETHLLEKTNGPLEEYLMAVSVKQYIEERLSNKWNVKCFTYLGKVVLLAMLEKEEAINAFTDYMDRVCKMTEKVLGVSIFAGIGQPYKELSKLSLSYESASTVIAYRILHEGSRALSIFEIEPRLLKVKDINIEGMQLIIRAIKVGDKLQLQEAINNFIRDLKTSHFTYQQFQIVSMEVVTELFKLGASYQIELQNIFTNNASNFLAVNKVDTVDKLEQILSESSYAIRNLIRQERMDNTQLLIVKAKSFMEENYQNSNCTIELLCNHLNISACYFSTLFKKETGTTVINYLTDIRMQKAKELLKNSDLKTYMIAEKVGYAEPNYFSYVFKKHFKISPTAYRASEEMEK